MDDLRSVLDRYHPRGDVESADVDRLRRLVDNGDPWSRGGRLHVTASALVVDPVQRRVLVTVVSTIASRRQ